MAIPTAQLHLRYGDVALFNGSLTAGWEVYHAATETIIESGRVSVAVAKPADFTSAWEQALNLIEGRASTVYAKHRPVATIGNYSLFDADLILDGWVSDPDEGTLAHPLSGEFSGVSYSGIVALVNAILARVPGPTTWFWTNSPGAGQLWVKCIAVAGADSYNVYDGTTLLGNIANPAGSTLAVAAGTYSVRIAAVDGGVVGVCSFPVSVTVA